MPQPASVQDFLDLSQFLSADGGSERTGRLLDLRSLYRGGRYAFVEPSTYGLRDELAGGEIRGRERSRHARFRAAPWDRYEDSEGALVPHAFRAPAIQLGTTDVLMATVQDLTVGEGRFPTIVPDEPKGEGTEGNEPSATAQALTALLGPEQIDLEGNAPGHIEDLAGVGAAVFGFHRVDLGGAERWEHVRIEPEWADPIFVGQFQTDKAFRRAKELADSGVQLATVVRVDGEEPVPVLPMPKDPLGSDLLFLRYRWPSNPRVSDGRVVSVQWNQVDYTTDAIIEYDSLTVGTADKKAPDGFRLAADVRPHGWGFVPLEWVVGRNAAQGETEGQSIFTEAVQSMTEEADRTASFWRTGVWVNSAPQAVEVDLQNPEADIVGGFDNDGAPISNVSHGGARRVVVRTSISDKPGHIELMETSGAAAEAAAKLVNFLTQSAHDSARVHRHNPEVAAGVMSGEAMERQMRPTIALISGFRTKLTRHYRRLSQKAARASAIGDSLVILVTWPPVFKPTAADANAWAMALTMGVQGAFLSEETAVEQFARVIGTDPEKELKRLAEGQETALDRARRTLPPPVPPTPEPEPAS